MAVIYILNTKNLTTDLSKYQNIPLKRLEKIKNSTNNLFIKESLGAQLLLNEILENTYFLDLEKIEYIYNENNKPYLKDIPIYFSISHSNGIVVVIVSKYQEVGLDIEFVKKHNINVARKILNQDELKIYEQIKTFNEQNDYFYQIWTSKEAYVKKRGSTISLNPSKITIDEEVLVKQLEIEKKLYYLAVCGVDSFNIVEYHIPNEFKTKENKK